MCFKDTSLSTPRNIVGEKEFWKVIVIIEIYYYIFGSLLV